MVISVIFALQSDVTGNDLGFELVGGKDDPQFPDSPIFVTNIHPESPAYTKLRSVLWSMTCYRVLLIIQIPIIQIS